LISRKFIRHSFIYSIAGALPVASAVILLPAYLNYLPTEVYGELALYMSFALLVQILVTYSFDTSIYNFFHDFKHDENQLHIFVSSVFSFILLVSLIAVVVFSFIGGWTLGIVSKHMTFYPYGMMSVITGVFQAIFKVNSSLQQTQEKASSFLFNNLISFSLIAALTIVGLKLFPNDLFGPIAGRLIAVTISGIWVIISIYSQHGVHLDFKLVKSTFAFNHPSILYQFLQWMNLTFDRYVLAPLINLTAVGIYDIAAKCLQVVDFILGGLNATIFPKVLGITALQSEKKTTVEINRYYHGLTAVTILLVVLSIFLLPIVLRFLIVWFDKPQYLDVIQWIPFVAVTYLLRSIRFYVVMPYAVLKYAKPLPLFYLVIVGTKIASMVALIPMLGIQGVIIATWIGQGVELVVLYLGIQKKMEVRFNVVKLIISPLVMAVVIVIAEPWLGRTQPILVHAVYVILAVAVLAWAYRSELKDLQLGKILK
jgi:O-antigen/teichoic acid export membrane protein